MSQFAKASKPAAETQRKKSRRATSAQTPESRSPPAIAETDQSASSSGAAAGGPQPLSLPQEVLDHLVAQVADEDVFRPPEGSGTRNSNTLVSNAASELPLVSTSLPPARAIPVPGTAVAASGLAGTIVQRSVGTTQASLSGEV